MYVYVYVSMYMYVCTRHLLWNILINIDIIIIIILSCSNNETGDKFYETILNVRHDDVDIDLGFQIFFLQLFFFYHYCIVCISETKHIDSNSYHFYYVILTVIISSKMIFLHYCILNAFHWEIDPHMTGWFSTGYSDFRVLLWTDRNYLLSSLVI